MKNTCMLLLLWACPSWLAGHDYGLPETIRSVNQLLSNSVYTSEAGNRFSYRLAAADSAKLVITGRIDWKRYPAHPVSLFRVTIDPALLDDGPELGLRRDRCMVVFNSSEGGILLEVLDPDPAAVRFFTGPPGPVSRFWIPVGRARYSASLLRAGMDKILSLLRNLPAGIAGGSRVVSPMAEFRAIKTREEWTGTIRFIDFRKNFDGTFEVPAVVNGVLKVDFLFDSGASEVTISSDLASVLARSGTIRSEDWLPAKTFLFADGSQASNPRFMARSLEIGPYRIENVEVAVSGSAKAPILLGQNVMGRFGKITIDNERNRLVIMPREWPLTGP